MNERTAILDQAMRLAQLHAFVPQVFGEGTLLYVGASVRRAQFLDELIASGRQVTILEAYIHNCTPFRQREDIVAAICGDVRHVREYGLGTFDVAFWWHGPEHVTREELPQVLHDLEGLARLVVLGCPWGAYPQKEIDGNEYEVHASALYPIDFMALGYQVATLGQPGGRKHSNILAWK